LILILRIKILGDMGKPFVFGKTKVAKTSEEIREHSESKTEAAPANDVPVTDTPVVENPATDTSDSETPATETTSATSKSEDENKQDGTTSVTETVSTQQEGSGSSAPLESKEQKSESTNKPVTAIKNRRSKNTTNRFALNGVKTENGIVVNVPMDDYMQLMMLKIQTGRTLKDLALQAIHEFVDRNKM
jgi:hypothetical protein